MAIKLEDKPNTEAPSTAYPYGNIKDNPGDNSGTPVNKLVYADFHQFFAKLMDAGAVVYNGLAESFTDGFQYFIALVNVIKSTIDEYINEVEDLSATATAAAGLTVISKKVYKWKNKDVYVEFTASFAAAVVPKDILNNLPKPIPGFKPELAYIYGLSAEDFSNCILYNVGSVGRLKNLDTFTTPYSVVSFAFFYKAE